MPVPVASWTLERAAWVNYFIALVALLASGCLLWLSPLLALPLAWVVWRCSFGAGQAINASWLFRAPEATLGLDSHGNWSLLQKGHQQQARLVWVWPASFWLTLRLVLISSNGEVTVRHCTVWRSRVGAAAWRQLRIGVERSGMQFSARPVEVP